MCHPDQEVKLLKGKVREESLGKKKIRSKSLPRFSSCSVNSNITRRNKSIQGVRVDLKIPAFSWANENQGKSRWDWITELKVKRFTFINVHKVSYERPNQS